MFIREVTAKAGELLAAYPGESIIIFVGAFVLCYLSSIARPY